MEWLALYALACWGVGYLLESDYAVPSLAHILLAPVTLPWIITVALLDYMDERYLLRRLVVFTLRIVAFIAVLRGVVAVLNFYHG